VLTVAEVIQKSSNVGVVRWRCRWSGREMWELFSQVGFGQKPQLQFPRRGHRAAAPVQDLAPDRAGDDELRLRPVHEPVQLARAYTVFARNGEVIPVSMLEQSAPAPACACFQPETVHELRKMLQMAAGPGGTGAEGAHARLQRGRQVRHRAQAGGQGLRLEQVPLVVRRPGADPQSAHRRAR
jgi:cell division protein FtsI (penicillin-binding protein 3)